MGSSYISAILRWLGKVTMIIAIGGATALIFGLVRGWDTPAAFGTGLFFVGVAIAALGALGSVGTISFAANPDIRYIQTVSPESPDERNARYRLDLFESNALTFLFLVAGLICIIAGGILARVG